MIIASLILSLFLSIGQVVHNDEYDTTGTYSIAFLSDVHLHDIFITSELAEGLPLPVLNNSNQHILARTLDAQLRSTRLFNENFFAFTQALDDLVGQGIRFVVLNGDFTDDGQPINVELIKSILHRYTQDYHFRFFLSPGNHDPGKPVHTPAGKSNFMNESGNPIGIYSTDHHLCRENQGKSDEIFCKDFIQELGYSGIFNELSDYGFMPLPTDLYFETPFSERDIKDYNFDDAAEKYSIHNRTFISCSPATYELKTYNLESSTCFNIPDLSYLIEPVEGLWLVSIDANVYEPRSGIPNNYSLNTPFDSLDSNFFNGAGNAGYNAVIMHKPHLLDWIKSITERGNEQNKTIVFFSHYPATSFYNGSEEIISSLFGQNSHQLSRSPKRETSKALASTGMKLHFGGHMHMNNTGVYSDSTDAFLINIQVPSISAYPPAYKIARFSDRHTVTVETRKLEHVADFNTLFSLYTMIRDSTHHDHVTIPILESDTYWEFAKNHLENLVSLRFIPDDWTTSMMIDLDESIQSMELTIDTVDFIQDFYKLRNGGSISHIDIPEDRLNLYKTLSIKHLVNQPTDAKYFSVFEKLILIMDYFHEAYPDDNFSIDLTSGNIYPDN